MPRTTASRRGLQQMSAAPPARARSRFFWPRVVLLLAVLATILWFYSRIDLAAVRSYMERLNPFAVFAALTLLPLVGFPVTLLQVAAGIRFGTAWGLVLVALSVALQLLASYYIVSRWRHLVAERLESSRRQLPAAAHSTVCWFTMLLPGVPYFLKNYVLPLVGVPLRTYLLICWPVHVARSVVAVVLGDQSDHLTPARIAGLTIYYIVVIGTSAWLFRRLRAQLFPT